MERLVDGRSPWATRISPGNIQQMQISDLGNQFNRFTLLISPTSTLISWLQNNKLLASAMKCEKCDKYCTMNARKKSIDEFTWRCKNRHEISIRRFSFFSKSHLYIPDIINFVLNYAEGYSLYSCAKNSAMAYGSTAVDWGTFCRDLFLQYYVEVIQPVKLSGIVEIDESLFGRRIKYHRGDSRGQKVWIFGLVEQETNRMKLFPVDNRSADTLIQLVKDNVASGSTIYSDGWSAYNSLSSLGYNHYVVEHKLAFREICTNPSTGQTFVVHTNTIEGCWKHAKAYFRRMNGTKIPQFEGHLCELMWRWWDRQNKSVAILNLIRSYYMLTKEPSLTAKHPVFPTWSGQQASVDDSLSRFQSSDDDDDSEDESREIEEHDRYLLATTAVQESHGIEESSIAARLATTSTLLSTVEESHDEAHDVQESSTATRLATTSTLLAIVEESHEEACDIHESSTATRLATTSTLLSTMKRLAEENQDERRKNRLKLRRRKEPATSTVTCATSTITSASTETSTSCTATTETSTSSIDKDE